MSRLEAALRRAQALNDQSDAPEADPKAERMSRALAALADTPPPVSTASSPTNVRTAGFYAEKLVVTERPEQSTIEQYRKLAATLHHAQTERQLKVVMVSSAVSGDGKTLTSTNLALTLSESYRRRVLLIDAAILVIGAGKTPHKLIMRAIDALGRNRILGVVLNRVDPSCLAGGYGYGYYSYGERG